jgi:hypothetical protein
MAEILLGIIVAVALLWAGMAVGEQLKPRKK